MDTNTLIQTIQQCLSPDLLKPCFLELWDEDNPTYGHCYVATETLYHLLGGENSDYKPYRARDKGDICHWWLENDAGERLDVTKEQYAFFEEEPPYGEGKGGGFLTKTPSRRAQILINRVKARLDK